MANIPPILENILFVLFLALLIAPPVIADSRRRRNVLRLLEEYEIAARRRGWSFTSPLKNASKRFGIEKSENGNPNELELFGNDEGVAWNLKVTWHDNHYHLRWIAALDLVPDKAKWRDDWPIEFGPPRSFPEGSSIGRLVMG